MAFLDFIKNRQAEQQKPAPEQPKQQTPQTAREMYAARDAEEKANHQPLTPELKEMADRVMGTLDKSTSHMRSQSAPAPPESGGHSEPMRQNALNQDREAHALSPTTEQVGKVAEQPAQDPAKEMSNSPSRNDQQKSQTPARDRGGWDR